MFFFFSNRLGCLGSLLLSAGITVALLFMFGMLRFWSRTSWCIWLKYFYPSMTTAGGRLRRKNMPPSGNISPSGSAGWRHPLARSGHDDGRRQDGARRDCRVRSHDQSAGRRMVEELQASVGAGFPTG